MDTTIVQLNFEVMGCLTFQDSHFTFVVVLSGDKKISLYGARHRDLISTIALLEMISFSKALSSLILFFFLFEI